MFWLLNESWELKIASWSRPWFSSKTLITQLFDIETWCVYVKRGSYDLHQPLSTKIPPSDLKPALLGYQRLLRPVKMRRKMRRSETMWDKCIATLLRPYCISSLRLCLALKCMSVLCLSLEIRTKKRKIHLPYFSKKILSNRRNFDSS